MEIVVVGGSGGPRREPVFGSFDTVKLLNDLKTLRVCPSECLTLKPSLFLDYTTTPPVPFALCHPLPILSDTVSAR